MSENTTSAEEIVGYAALTIGVIAIGTVALPALVAVEGSLAAVSPFLGEAFHTCLHHGLKELPHLLR